MKIKIVLPSDEQVLTCESAKIADGFLQIKAPKEEDGRLACKELLIAISQIKMLVVLE